MCNETIFLHRRDVLPLYKKSLLLYGRLSSSCAGRRCSPRARRTSPSCPGRGSSSCVSKKSACIRRRFASRTREDHPVQEEEEDHLLLQEGDPPRVQEDLFLALLILGVAAAFAHVDFLELFIRILPVHHRANCFLVYCEQRVFCMPVKWCQG